MPAVIQVLKKDKQKYILVGSFINESEATDKLQELKALGRYAFIETTRALYAGDRKYHIRYNVWARTEEY